MHTTRPRTVTAEQERARKLRTRHPGWEPHRLREARQALGWSRPTLARKICAIHALDVSFTPPIANEQTIMRHERGWAYPSEDWQAAYTHTMGTGRVDLGFCIRETHSTPTITHRALPSGPPATDDEWVRRLWATPELSDTWEEVTTIDRREFSALTGLALLGAAHEWLVADPARIAAALEGRRADATVIADLTTTMDALRRMDDKLGGQAVNGMIVEQLRLVVRLLRHASYTQTDGQALHGIAAELSRLAGWTAYDAGAHGTAQRFFLVGLRAAHEADAPGVAANILRCMAHQARSKGDSGTAVELLRSARAGSRGRLTSTEQAILAAGLASAYGVAGDRKAALAESDTAYAAIDKAQPDDDPPYVYWAGPYTIAHSVGAALISTGDPAGAIPHFEAAIDRIGTELPRDRLGFLLNLAMAHTQAGDPDAAISITRDAITTTTVPSSIMAGRIHEVCQAITAAGHPEADDLAEHARSITGTPDL